MKYIKVLVILLCMILPWAMLMFLVSGLYLYSDMLFKDPDFPHLVPLFVLVALGCLGCWLAVRSKMGKWRKRMLVFVVVANALISIGVFSFNYEFEYYEWNGSQWQTTNWLHTEVGTFMVDGAYGEYLMAPSIGHRLPPVFDPTGKKVGHWTGSYEQRIIVFTSFGMNGRMMRLHRRYDGNGWVEELDTKNPPRF